MRARVSLLLSLPIALGQKPDLSDIYSDTTDLTEDGSTVQITYNLTAQVDAYVYPMRSQLLPKTESQEVWEGQEGTLT